MLERYLFVDDEEGSELFSNAKDLIAKGNYIKALEIIEDLLLVYGEKEGSWLLHSEEAIVFAKLSRATEKPDLGFTYMLAAVACYAEDETLSPLCAQGLYILSRHLGSVLYYKECVRIAKQGLYVCGLEDETRKELVRLIKDSEFMISVSKTESIKKVESKFLESKRSPDPVNDEVKGLRLYWMGLDVKIKRDFMKVSIEKVRSFVERVHKKEGLEALDKVLAYAREHEKWTSWVCRTICLSEFSSDEKCKAHLEQQHAADFKPDLEKDLVMRIGKNWANKIQVGRWEPLDTVAAVDMIKTQLEDVKAFTTRSKKKGWSNQWPLAVDEKRSSLLKDIKLILVSLCERQILSCSIRDWVMRFPVKHLRKLEVSEQSISDCHIVETPQSICFLERDELSQIRGFLNKIKCERYDGTDQVCRAVDSVLDHILIKESIEVDEQFSLLLLDKRLLKSNNFPFDDDGKISFIKDPGVHYAKAQAQGNDIISWLGDCSSVDKSFPKPIREHNLGIWVAVLRAVQYKCRALGSKYAKKTQVLDYEAALTFVENVCVLEGERRKIVDDVNSYASLLCDGCEERVPENSLTTKLFLCVVRDVLKEARDLTFDFPDLEDCLSLIREGKFLEDEVVLKSIELLKSMVTEKVLLIDAKILLIDNSRIRLLDKLTSLSAFDNRSYMLQLLKPFLLNEIVNMESKAKSDAADAAEAYLLLKEEEKSLKEAKKKSQAKKAKKAKSIKKTSTSMSSPVDKLVEQKPSIDLEPGATSQSPKTMEEDSMEPEDTLTTEKGPLEISSTNDIREEATKGSIDMQNMPGEDSVSGNLESALGGAVEADLLHKKEKKSRSKKKNKTKSIKITSTRMSSPVDKTVEQKPSMDLQPGGSQSPKMMEEDSMEQKETLASERGGLEISCNTDIREEATKVNHGDMPGEDSLSGHLESALGGAPVRYNSALDMTLKALMNINVLKEDLKYNKQPFHDDLEKQVPCALQSLFTDVVSGEIKTEGVYSLILSDLLVSLEQVNSVSSDAAEVLVIILESWHCWKDSERESLVTRLFTLEENERTSCKKCGRKSNYPEQSSYGIVMAADSIRNVKCAFEDIKFVNIIKVIRAECKMLCDIKTGGCGRKNLVHHVISKCPSIFIIVLEWEKSETEKEISETTKALEWEIDISRLYDGLEPNTNYRLVSMVGYSEEKEEHQICIAYEKNRWFNLRRESLAGEVVGNWKNVVRFCEERKIRPEILFYEAARSSMT